MRRPQSRRQKQLATKLALSDRDKGWEDDAVSDAGVAAVEAAMAARDRLDPPIEIIRPTPMDPSASGISAIYHDLNPSTIEGTRDAAKGKRHGMKVMPLNPLTIKANLRKRDAPTRTAAADSVLSKRGKEARAFKLGDEDVMRICDKYAERQWYAFAWRFMRRHWPHDSWNRHFRKIQMLGALSLTTLLYVIHLMYRREMEMFEQLSAEDQRGYQHLRWTLRAGELIQRFNVAMEVIDPLDLLPGPERISRFIAVARKEGLLDTNVELEQRKWPRWFEQLDVEHLWYWTVMYWGRIINGGSTQSWNPYSPDQLGIVGDEQLRQMKEAAKAVYG